MDRVTDKLEPPPATSAGKVRPSLVPESIDAGIRRTVQQAYQASEWWRAHLDGAGVDPFSVHGRADLSRLPFTTKQDLRDAYPLGWVTVPDRDIRRVHASSGTTGKRTLCAYTDRDLQDWADQFARCYRYAGVTETDRVQVMVGFGLWTAGSGFQSGAERVGAMTVPTGPGNVELQLEMMRDLGTTTICATSSFALLIAEEVASRHLRDALSLRRGIIGSERWGSGMRARIDDLLGIESFDVYGLTELYGPGVGIDCDRHDGIHVWSDYYVVEIIDPETLDPVDPGKEGEIVITTLRKEAMPLLRYRTRDRSWLYPEPCSCGSPFPRIGRILGRTDDMVKVRGVAIHPAQVDSVLSTVEGVGPEYQIHISRPDGRRDRLVVRVEGDAAPDAGTSLSERLHQVLGIRAEVEIVGYGSLPRTDRKARRVFDSRSDEDAGDVP
ncbi:MAG: phenylacetate--CoA ligase [Actinomycetota bacterium]|nr:phenylacetate--CoA ligase [Actinomycetota bacterium]